MNKIIQRLHSKTYLTAVALAAISAIEINAQLLTGWVPAEYKPWLLMVWPVAMLTLREVTTGALSDK